MTSLWGVRARVILVAVLPALVLASLLVGLYYSVRSSELEETYLSRGAALARQLSAATEYALFSGNKESLQQQINVLMEEEGMLGVAIIDHRFQMLASSDTFSSTLFPSGTTFAPLEKQGGLFRISQPIRSIRLEIDDDFIAISRPQPSADIDAIGYVILDLSSSLVQTQQKQLLVRGILTVAAVLFAALLLAFRMSRQVSGPIREVADVVQRIGQGRFEERVPLLGGGSLRSLANGVNEMASELASMHEDMNRRILEATAELRARKEEAEKANTAKSRFLAAASHDLRQPMHALGLFIAELSECRLSPRARTLQERIAEAATAMEQLLESLLDISKLDAGILRPNRQAFALNTLVNRIVMAQQRIAREHDVSLIQRCRDVMVYSDPLLVERIINNLISNAITHGGFGARILIACRVRGDAVDLEVRDNGPGIPQDAQDIVFQEFVQLDNPGRLRDRGLGLGLAIVRRLSDLLQLELRLRSDTGKGSTFVIRLPIAQPEQCAPNNAQSHLSGKLDGVVVAIVEDDPLALAAMTSLLSSWGCTVISGASPFQLLEQARTAPPPSIILSDYRLGDMDGIQAIQHLRKSLGEDIPAALITGDTATEVLQLTEQAGLPVLNKPLRPAKLRALITRCARRQH